MAVYTDKVIVVNEKDEWTGTAEKMEAHRSGMLHRAISIFITNSRGEMLLQQRALDKYHSGGLWSNACCSHPAPGESTLSASHRRLREEMGFDCVLEQAFTFRYSADVGNGLIENEFDHIFTGIYDGLINFNKDEVNGYKYVPISEITILLEKESNSFTPWFRLVFSKILMHLNKEVPAI